MGGIGGRTWLGELGGRIVLAVCMGGLCGRFMGGRVILRKQDMKDKRRE